MLTEIWLISEFCNRGPLLTAVERGAFLTQPSSQYGQPNLIAVLQVGGGDGGVWLWGWGGGAAFVWVGGWGGGPALPLSAKQPSPPSSPSVPTHASPALNPPNPQPTHPTPHHPKPTLVRACPRFHRASTCTHLHPFTRTHPPPRTPDPARDCGGAAVLAPRQHPAWRLDWRQRAAHSLGQGRARLLRQGTHPVHAVRMRLCTLRMVARAGRGVAPARRPPPHTHVHARCGARRPPPRGAASPSPARRRYLPPHRPPAPDGPPIGNVQGAAAQAAPGGPLHRAPVNLLVAHGREVACEPRKLPLAAESFRRQQPAGHAVVVSLDLGRSGFGGGRVGRWRLREAQGGLHRDQPRAANPSPTRS